MTNGNTVTYAGACALLIAGDGSLTARAHTEYTPAHSAGTVAPQTRGARGSHVIRVPLEAENASGEVGTAILTGSVDGTLVTISLLGVSANTTQPANIHAGTCGSVEVIEYALADVKNGSSKSRLAIPLERLAVSGFVVDVQDSIASLHAAKDARDVSCGKIGRPIPHAARRYVRTGTNAR